jgi:hypothetical protein
MIPIRVVAIPTEIADAVRSTHKDPHYGHPAHTEVAGEGAPCRHCLQFIAAGSEKATLFTYDAFEGIESLPLPGPVYIHAEACDRHPENGGFPPALRNSPRTLNAYARGQRLVATEYVENGTVEDGIEKLFAREDVDYIHVRSTTAGCYTFRIERADRPSLQWGIASAHCEQSAITPNTQHRANVLSRAQPTGDMPPAAIRLLMMGA